MKRRRLRKLVPDPELIRRRAVGEPLRELASEYDVAHTTLVRYFERPEVARQLKDAKKQLRAEEQALAARRAASRKAEREVRRLAKEQTATEREQARQIQAAVSANSPRRRRAPTDYEAWLAEREAPVSLTRRDLWSQADYTAASVVAAGGGMQAVIEATFGSLENVVRLIDPSTLKKAYDNDVLAGVEPPAV